MPVRLSRSEWQRVSALLAEWPLEALHAMLDPVLERWRCSDLRAAIQVRWNPRLRTTLGRALLQEMVIELNPRLLARYPEQLRAVLIHEAAHLVVQRLHGRQPDHGKFWKAYMRAAGESTAATHHLAVGDLANRKRRVRS